MGLHESGSPEISQATAKLALQLAGLPIPSDRDGDRVQQLDDGRWLRRDTVLDMRLIDPV